MQTPRKGFWLVLRAAILSIVIYSLLFGLLLKKPISVGPIRDMFSAKVAAAAAGTHPMLILMGGSNVRYSHSCALLSAGLKHSCVNAGMTADVGFDLLTMKFEHLLQRGDAIYLPLEYEQYVWGRAYIESQTDAAYLIQYDKAALVKMPLSRGLNALFHFGLTDLVAAPLEMALSAFNVGKPAGTASMNSLGDAIGHTSDRAMRYREFVARNPWQPPSAEHYWPQDAYVGTLVSSFVARMLDRGVKVIGGLPTTTDVYPVPPEIAQRIKELYLQQGAGFIQLANKSQYPSECFYDAGYHLNQECQMQHSKSVLVALQAQLSD